MSKKRCADCDIMLVQLECVSGELLAEFAKRPAFGRGSERARSWSKRVDRAALVVSCMVTVDGVLCATCAKKNSRTS